MSNSVKIIPRPGAYEHPFSGLGLEFDPLGVQADRTGLVLHETGYDRANSHWNFPSVLSPFWRVYYNAERSHCIVFGDAFYELGPDHIVLIPDHQLFHCLGQRPTPAFWVHFSFDQKPASDQPIPILLKPGKAELGLINSIRPLMQENSVPAERIRRLSLALLNVLVSRPEIRWRPALPVQLTMLIRHIDENAGRKIPNEELAKLAGISVEGIYRMFRNHLGASPTNYISQIRIRKASHLLKQNEYGIDEIAELTGFPNRAYFSRVFKQITGMSPGSYRTSL
ncbi:helix-turn-helix domain-containing protein [Pontiella sulfatireligans]|uniref:HTH-type transcriptional activator Btr n=1 Tax=Pontiella sulfatireligans TaxID=2750658 RepID=A0A6C2UG98_9BACT|nr:AraC family transcriptional regulator [Pontiella sulfatireligans]VGO19195.1 HTH-type transcriptional activator Btr [Pontiella sulfatireligans]